MNLNHTSPGWVKSGALYFVTGCTDVRGQNILCTVATGPTLLEAARFYHEREDWFCRLWLLMPDHFHALISIPSDRTLSDLMGRWKRYTATKADIVWQKNFVDHRLRSGESWLEKAEYIRTNPTRAGLIREGERWPYILEH